MATPKKDPLEALKESGIPVQKATFHNTVESRPSKTEMTPEYALYHDHQKRTRKASMWYTPHGLLVEQGGGHKLIPLAQVKDTDLL